MPIGPKHAVDKTQTLQIVLVTLMKKKNNKTVRLHCLTLNKHVTSLQSMVYCKLKLLNRISYFLSHDTLLRINKQTVLDYSCAVWSAQCSKENTQHLECLQNWAM